VGTGLCAARGECSATHRQFFVVSSRHPLGRRRSGLFESEEAPDHPDRALPGVEPDKITVTLSAGVAIVSGERPAAVEVRDARIHRLDIPPRDISSGGRDAACSVIRDTATASARRLLN